MKKFRWIIAIVLLLGAAVAVWFWKFRKLEKPLILQTETPVIGDMTESITAIGTIQPLDTVAVGTQVSGIIQNVYVDFNSKVKKGELLAQIDKSVLQAQVDQIRANLQQAKDNLTYQTSNHQRQEQLYQAGAISKADYELALNQYNTAKNQVRSIEAQLQQATRNLSYTEIYSPIDGTVLSRNVSAGQTVAASFNTPTLFSIARDLTKMQVKAAVDEADIGNVKKGERASFTVDAFPQLTFDGTVSEVRLQPSVSANVVTYVTIISAPNADMKLKPGMTANITIYTKEIDSTLMVTARALQFEPDSILSQKFVISEGRPKRQRRDSSSGEPGRMDMAGPVERPGNKPDDAGNQSSQFARVWLKKDSSIVSRRIRIGMKDNLHAQVLSGLSTSDTIVTGYEVATEVTTGSSGPARSPFLPSRPGRRNNRPQGRPGG